MTAGTSHTTNTAAAPVGAHAEAWRAAGLVLDDILATWDTPRLLAEQDYLRRSLVEPLRAALHALAALVQRLVLLMALSLTLDPAPLRLRARPLLPRRQRRVAVRACFLKWPETWGVSLPGLFEPAARPAPAPRSDIARAGRSEPRAVLPLWGSAVRLEALRRLIADPAPAARRLAFRLARAAKKGEAGVAPTLRRWTPPRDPESAPYLAARCLADLHPACEVALAARAVQRKGEPVWPPQCAPTDIPRRLEPE